MSMQSFTTEVVLDRSRKRAFTLAEPPVKHARKDMSIYNPESHAPGWYWAQQLKVREPLAEEVEIWLLFSCEPSVAQKRQSSSIGKRNSS
jgi:hypothetical protein